MAYFYCHGMKLHVINKKKLCKHTVLTHVLKDSINKIAYLINYSQNTCLLGKIKFFSYSLYKNKSYAYHIGKVSKGAKIRNRYNKLSHLSLLS